MIEEALRESLLIGPLEAIWSLQEGMEPLTDEEAMSLALEAQEWARTQRAQEAAEAKNAA